MVLLGNPLRARVWSEIVTVIVALVGLAGVNRCVKVCAAGVLRDVISCMLKGLVIEFATPVPSDEQLSDMRW